MDPIGGSSMQIHQGSGDTNANDDRDRYLNIKNKLNDNIQTIIEIRISQEDYKSIIIQNLK